MSLPRSLVYAVQRFQTAQRETVRLFPLQKRDFSENEVISFRFPASGVLDLHSLAMHFQHYMQGTGTNTGTTSIFDPIYYSEFIRRVDVMINGVTVGLNALSDYGLAYLTKYKYADTSDRAVYKSILEGAQSHRIVNEGANQEAPQNGMIADWLGFLSGSHVRYLPLAAFGELQIDITLHNRRRWVASDTTAGDYAKINATTHQLRNVRMLYTKVHFEDNLLDNMVAARLSRGTLQIPFENWAQWEGNAFSGTTTFNFQVATQSLDHIFGSLRPDNYSTVPANNVRLASGGENSTFQFTVNANPVSSWQLAVPEVFWATAEALEGNNNALYAPSMTYAEFRDRYFAYIHSFAFPLDLDESKTMITGLSTYGQTVPLTFEVTGTSTVSLGGGNVSSYRPFVTGRMTSICELNAGRMITYIQ
jgi:hypothetical protein